MSTQNNLNKVILIGNLGTNPELRYTGKGTAVVNLAIATSRNTKNNNGEWEEHTEWHHTVTWGKRAENCAKFLNKGDRVYIEGQLQKSSWQDSDNNTHWKTEIHADDVKFLSQNKKGSEDVESTEEKK